MDESAGEPAPHCTVHTPAPTIISTATTQMDEFSVSNGSAKFGTSTPPEALPETHTLIRTTSFQINEFSVSDPIPIPQIKHCIEKRQATTAVSPHGTTGAANLTISSERGDMSPSSHDNLTQIQSQGQNLATIDEKPLETKLNIGGM